MSVNPKNTLSIDNSTSIQSIEVLGVPEYEIPDYDLTDHKQYMKFLFNIEKVCRKSFEYKQLMKFLKDFGGMNKDSFLENVTIENGAKIEIHHSPLTLFDIVNIIVCKREALGESLSIPLVAKEVLYVHYKLIIGLIPLCKTVHELVHGQYLYIPSWAVLGNFKEFLRLYDQWIPLEVRSNLENLEKMSEEYDINKVTKILESKLININVNNKDYHVSNEELFNTINEYINIEKEKSI